MASSDDHHPEYDANLLSTAPAPTKGMVQSGYATDLLEVRPKPDDLEAAAGRHNSLLRPNRHPERTEPKLEPSTSYIRTKLPPPPPPVGEPAGKKPFYRTTKGIVVLVIVAIVLLAAIIGGAVGGALAKKKSVPVPDQTGVSGPAVSRLSESSALGGIITIRKTTTLGDSPQSQDGVATSVVRITTTIDPLASPRISSVGSPLTASDPGVSIGIASSVG